MKNTQSKKHIIDKLVEYSKLPDGWNGPGSSGPTSECSSAIMRAIDLLCNFDENLPVPMISNSGNLELYWNNETDYTDISFDANGIASFFYRGPFNLDPVPEIWIDDLTF